MYSGKILDVNLSADKLRDVRLDEKITKEFIGGLGFCMKILYDNVGIDVDPLSENNLLIIAPGALTGTIAPCSSRVEISAKSPLTNALGTGNFGGRWGVALKHAGYDAIIIRNRADQPKYLSIQNDNVELRSAEHLWGKDTFETTDLLKSKLGRDTRIMAIGQAGENLVRFACPIVEYFHAAGGSHTGAVMGSKKLKAIAVRGTTKIAVANAKRFHDLSKEINRRIMSFPGFDVRRKHGALILLRGGGEAGTLAVKNYQESVLPGFLDSMTYEVARDHLITGKPFCPNCSVGCTRIAEITTGKYAGTKIASADYPAAIGTFGTQPAITDLSAVWKSKELAHRYGMDIYTPIPFAMELYQRGIITKKDTELDISWGNADAFMEMMRKIAYRDGFGDILAEGIARAAKKIGKGAEKYALVVRRSRFAGPEPRSGTYGEGNIIHTLGVMTCPRGGDDLKTTHDTPEKFINPVKFGGKEIRYLTEEYVLANLDMFEEVKDAIYGWPRNIKPRSSEGKTTLTKWYGDLFSALNALGICMFPATCFCAIGPTMISKLYSAGIGWDVTPQELMKAGEKIFNLMKCYAVRAGLTRDDDHLPPRFYEEPLAAGKYKGSKLSKEKMDRLIDEYNVLRGWDEKSGYPTREKLTELGLDYIADELEKLGKLGS